MDFQCCAYSVGLCLAFVRRPLLGCLTLSMTSAETGSRITWSSCRTTASENARTAKFCQQLWNWRCLGVWIMLCWPIRSKATPMGHSMPVGAKQWWNAATLNLTLQTSCLRFTNLGRIIWLFWRQVKVVGSIVFMCCTLQDNVVLMLCVVHVFQGQFPEGIHCGWGHIQVSDGVQMQLWWIGHFQHVAMLFCVISTTSISWSCVIGFTLGDVYAHWENWWSELGLRFSNLTGPLAPHLFLLCSYFTLIWQLGWAFDFPLLWRLHNFDTFSCFGHFWYCIESFSTALRFEVMYLKDVGDLGDCRVSAWPGAPPSHPRDIVCVVRQRMSSRAFHQVALLVPGRGWLNQSGSLQ